MVTTVHHIRDRQAGDVYIGRAGNSEDGYFGNPYRVGHTCQRCGQFHATAGGTIACFRSYFEERIAGDPTFRANVLALRGKRLVCFCKPKPCHGDVIAEFCNNVWSDT